MARIELRNIVKKYENGQTAVKGISLNIAEGEFVVLVGPSGCGKSTTLRMIAGLEEISSGDLLFDGERMNEKEPKDRDIGMVFQNYALYPHLSVFDNIAFPLSIRKESKTEIRRKVESVAELLGLTEYLQRKPKQLSGGQRQRVALGRAIVRQPRVFLFDEPLSNLDAQLRTQMRSEISALQQKLGTTAIYVTHDQAEAMTMGDKIVLLRDGEIQQAGEPHEIYNNPQNRFTAGFLGSPSMNFFEGIITENGNELIFEENAGGICFKLPLSRFNSEQFGTKSKISMGIRPEHITLESKFLQSELNFSVKIELSEYLGHETLLHFSTGGTKKTVRISHEKAKGISENNITERQFFVDDKFIYCFDENGKRI